MASLLVLLLMAFQAGTASTQRPAVEPTGSIEGTVSLAGTADPIAGAQVALMKLSPPGSPPPFPTALSQAQQTAITDARGKFALRDIPRGSYRITAAREGFVFQEYGSRQPGKTGTGTVLDIAGGDALKETDIRLTPTGSVNGRVTNASGRPLNGMNVTLLRATYDFNGTRAFQIAGTAETNDLGAYRLYWLTPGRYYVAAGPSPLQPSSSAGVPGQKHVTTFFPGVTDATTAVMIEVKPGQDLNGIDVPVQQTPTYRIRGHVAGLQSGGGVGLSISPRQPLPSTIRMPASNVPSNADGSFELKDVLPGQYWIRAQSGPDSPSAVAAVDIVAKDLENVSLTVTPAASIAGRVTLEGRSLPADSKISISLSPLTVRDLFTPGPPASAVNADGTFLQTNIASGEYQVNVRGLAPNVFVKDAHFGAVDVLGGTLLISGAVSDLLNIDLSAQGAQLEGVAKDSRQTPVARATVVLVPDIRRDRRYLFRAATSDATGRFTLRGIPPGDYKLFAWEDLESYAYFNADVLKPYESKGTLIHISDSSRQNADVGVIRSEAEP